MSDRTQYFRKFPLTVYKDQPAINIMKRVDFNSNVRNFFSAFYTHTADGGEKVENIAFDYYNDVDFDWLIYHTNDVLDPYHGVALNYEDFNNTIIKKYGSVEKAKKKTVLYRNNYRGDPSFLSQEGYDALTGGRKKYWSPEFGPLGLIGYNRNTDEMYASTNRIISFSFASTVTTTFTEGEIVEASNGATATVSTANTTYVTLKHINGSWDGPTSDFTVTGDDSAQTITFDFDSYKLLKDVIPADEQVYFSKYSAYDMEDDQNEALRELQIIDDSYAEEVNVQLDDLMRQ